MKRRGTLKSTILKEKTSKKPKTFSESVKKRPNYRPKNSKSQISNSKSRWTGHLPGGLDTASIIQLTEEFEFPAKTVFANNSMIIDLRLRF